jgi:phosphatidylserine synthase
MMEKQQGALLRNLANIVSILGVLPICILFGEHAYQYLIPLIIYNNFMDDLDGVLAAKLNIRSNFGALLDNVCDAVAHTAFVMFVGVHVAQQTEYSYLGEICFATSMLAAISMIVRLVTRIDPTAATGGGSPTNELIRHMFFILLLEQVFEFDPTPYLIVTFILHAASMLVPFKMPYLIRSLAKSATAISMVNVALLVAWLLPYMTLIVATPFVVTYLSSFTAGAVRWLRTADDAR